MKKGFIVTVDPLHGVRRTPVIEPLVAGRSSECDIVIEDVAASRKHVEIWREGDTFHWRDLGSTNGTIYNDKPSDSGLLTAGDRIIIGDTSLWFEIEKIIESTGEADSALFRSLIGTDGKDMQQAADVEKSVRLLRAVYRVMNQIATEFEPCALIDQILATCMKAIHAQRGAMFFTGSDRDELMPCASCGQVHMIENGRLLHVDTSGVKVSRTVAQRVLRHGVSQVYQDAQSDQVLHASESIVSLNLRSIICAPLQGKSGVLGLLYIDTNRPNHIYTTEDMLLVTAVGNSAGLAIENSRMHRELLDKVRMDQEIQHAGIIQEGFLVRDWPRTDNRFLVYGETRPAKTVGGDFYDFLMPTPDTAGILIGDVSGKGVPAALTMAQLLAEFRLRARATESPAAVLAALNTELFRRSRFGMFCTICYIVMDLNTGRLVCANAGHHPFLRLGKGGAEELAQPSGPPLGVLEEAPWTDEEARLEPGEILAGYTDGLVESRGARTRLPGNSGLMEFGLEGLTAILYRLMDMEPHQMAEGVFREVERFTYPAAPHDDCTLILLRRSSIGDTP